MDILYWIPIFWFAGTPVSVWLWRRTQTEWIAAWDAQFGADGVWDRKYKESKAVFVPSPYPEDLLKEHRRCTWLFALCGTPGVLGQLIARATCK